jgi:hypothetical protein
MNAQVFTNRKPKQPTTDQLFALINYANANGRTWKSKLNDDWMNGRAEGELQQVRNQFGPTWLARFKLPRVDIVATGDPQHPLRAVLAAA